MGDEYVSVEHLFLSLLKKPSREVKALLKEFNIDRERFLKGTFYGSRQPESEHPTTRRQCMRVWRSMVMIWCSGQGTRNLTR